MQSNETEKLRQEILKKKANFYYTSKLKCHIKLRPTGFLNGKIISEFIEEGSCWMFEEIRSIGRPYRLFIEEVFDIKDYEEPVKEEVKI